MGVFTLFAIIVFLLLIVGIVGRWLDNRDMKKDVAKLDKAKELYDRAYTEKKLGIEDHNLSAVEDVLCNQLPHNCRSDFRTYVWEANKRYEIEETGGEWKL